VNVFNRVMMILVILVVFIVLTIGLFVPFESLTVVGGVVGNTLHTLNRIRPEFVLPFRALLILCAILFDVLLVGLLVLEIRGPARHGLRVAQVGGGEVSVTAESLAERIQYHVDQLAGVIKVQVKVAPHGGGVDLALNIQTGSDVNVPEKAEQVLQVTRQVVEDKMGLKLGRKPRISIHAMPYPSAGARPTALSQSSSQPTPPTPPASSSPFSPTS
jgi:hypothetical protein